MNYKALCENLISKIHFYQRYQKINLENIAELQEEVSALKYSVIELEEERNDLERERDEALCDLDYFKGESASLEDQMGDMEDINEMDIREIAAHICGKYGGSMLDLENLENAIFDNMPKHLGTQYRHLA